MAWLGRENARWQDKFCWIAIITVWLAGALPLWRLLPVICMIFCERLVRKEILQLKGSTLQWATTDHVDLTQAHYRGPSGDHSLHQSIIQATALFPSNVCCERRGAQQCQGGAEALYCLPLALYGKCTLSSYCCVVTSPHYTSCLLSTEHVAR